MPQISPEIIARYKEWQKSPTLWIQWVFHLSPQPLKSAYAGQAEEAIKNGDWGVFAHDWFEPFEKDKHISWQQWLILLAVERGLSGQSPKRISVKSGKGIGKSTTLSWLLLWFLFCFKDAQVPCTAPTAPQMYDVLWKEAAKWINRMPPEVRQLYDWTATYIRIKESPQTWFASARTGSKESPEALAGIHGDYVLLLVDEGCFDEETDVLTLDGWKRFRDVKETDMILTMDEKTQTAEYRKPEKLVSYLHNGDMFLYQQRGVDFMITPNHRIFHRRFLTKRKVWGEWKLKEIQEFKNLESVYLKRDFKWIGVERTGYRIPAFYNGRKRFYSEREVNMDDWLEFLGWYLSEGSIMKRNGAAIGIAITQTKSQTFKQEIFSVCERLNFRPGKNRKDTDVFITSRQLGEHLKTFGDGFYHKKIPQFLKELSPRQIEIFLRSFLKGDGYSRGGRDIYYTSSPAIADGLQELIVKAGGYASICKRNIKGQKKWIIDHWAETKYDGFVIARYKENTGVRLRNKNVKKVPYKGMVYCAYIPPHHLLYTRRNGQCVWMGNSGIPDEIFTPAEGVMTAKHSLMMMISNPTRLIGYFYDSHRSQRERWQTLSFSSLDSPIVDPSYAEGIAAQHGEDSDEYKIHVLGEFPREDMVDRKGYVPLLLESDLVFIKDIGGFKRPRLGVDPSGEGDDKTTWVIRDQFKAKIVASENISNPKSIAQKTISLMDYYGIADEDTIIDNFGSGANVSQELALAGFRVRAVNVGEKPDDEERFANKRAEAFHRLKLWVRGGGELVRANEWNELLVIRYRREQISNKMKVMGKIEMRREGISSPNYADALMLTFISPERKAEARLYEESDEAIAELVNVYG